MCSSASLTWLGTRLLTSCACGRRIVSMAYFEQPVACASACWARRHLRRNARPWAGQLSTRSHPSSVARAPSAKAMSGRATSHDKPRLRTRSSQASTSCCSDREARRAAEPLVMFEHGANMTAVADRRLIASPMRPALMLPPPGCVTCASRTASWHLGSTRRKLSPGTKNDQGSGADCFRSDHASASVLR